MPYTYDPIFAADPNNAANVAANAAIIIFDPADNGKAPIAITDVTGSPLPNPITVNRNGFGPAFQHATLDRVGWFGAGFTGYFTSYEGIKAVAVAAEAAAQEAATNAAVAAASELSTLVAAGEFTGERGQDGLNGADGAPGLPGVNAVPADSAVATYASTAGTATRNAINTTVKTTAAEKSALALLQTTPIPASTAPTSAAKFTAVAGTRISTPAHADFAFKDDLDIQVLVAADDWSPTPATGTVMTLASRGNDAAENQLRFEISNQGQLILRWWNQGAGSWSLRSSGVNSVGRMADGALVWVRAVLDVSNTAGVAEVTFYTSADGKNWADLGATSGTALTAPVVLNAPAGEALGIGGYTVNGLTPLAGKIYEAKFRNGISGPIVAHFKADSLPYTDSTGKVWTVTGTGVALETKPVAAVSVIPGRANNEWQYNGTSYAQNIGEWGGFQFVTWVGADRYNRISKRTIGGNDWTTYSFQTLGGLLGAQVALDGHNVFALGIDSTGILHVAGNMHGDWIKYAKSTAAGDITGWTYPGMIRGTGVKTGTDEGLVSYPQFINNPVTNELFFFYRNGGSGNGDTYLNKYNTSTGAWTRVSQIFDGTATGESVYHNTPVFDSTGTLHLSFMWAPTGGTFNNRNDLSYMKSTDGGVTWKTMANAALPTPLTHANTPIILPTPSNTGLLNQTGMTVDGLNRPHIAYFYAPDGNRNIWHLYWNGTSWINERVTDFTETALLWTGLSRPAIVHHGGRLLVIWRHQMEGWRGKVWATDVTIPGKPRHIPIADMDLRDWEPAPDLNAIRRGVLSLLVTRINGDGTTPVPGYSEQNWKIQPLGLLSIDIARLDKLSPADLPTLPRDRP